MNNAKSESKNDKAAAGNAAPETPPPANDDAETAAAAIAAAVDEGAAAEPAARIAALEAEIAAKTGELAAFRDSAQRQLADMLNQRRRADNEAAEARKYGAAHFAREMLTISDNLKRALAAAAPDAAPGAASAGAPVTGGGAAAAPMLDSLRQGVELIDREFSAILERHGIKRIDPKGERFDPNFHQAMFEVETADAEPGTVVQVVQAGFKLHDRLLRAAMVGVAKAPATDPPAGEADGGAPDPE